MTCRRILPAEKTWTARTTQASRRMYPSCQTLISEGFDITEGAGSSKVLPIAEDEGISVVSTLDDGGVSEVRDRRHGRAERVAVRLERV